MSHSKIKISNKSTQEQKEIGPGAYEPPLLWNKPSLLSNIRNNPSFSFHKYHLDRSNSANNFTLPGVGKYSADALKLKKAMPRVSIDKSIRFQKHPESMGETYINISNAKGKINGVFYYVGNHITLAKIYS